MRSTLLSVAVVALLLLLLLDSDVESGFGCGSKWPPY